MDLVINPPARLCGRVKVPGDKSISHRAAICGALAHGVTVVHGFLEADDCLSTLSCLHTLGAQTEFLGDGTLHIRGTGGRLQPPPVALDAGNSGTTARLLLGVCAGQSFSTTITGDASLCRRPMARVAAPLRRMGATVEGGVDDHLPLTVRGGKLHGIAYTLPVASAQVKSALLLAGLFARGTTIVREPVPSRDHTELMLRHFGAALSRQTGGAVVLEGGGGPLRASAVTIPGDISAAAFFLVAGAIVPGSEIWLEGVGLNPTRAGLLEVLREMGASIEEFNRRESGGEVIADLCVRGGRPLQGATVSGAMIPRLIDELPVLAVVATCAAGVTVFRDAAELRVKETDRIAALSSELRRLGAVLEEHPDGLTINGGQVLRGTVVQSHGDHRLAMALAVAGLVARGRTVVQGAEAARISYPLFAADLENLFSAVSK